MTFIRGLEVHAVISLVKYSTIVASINFKQTTGSNMSAIQRVCVFGEYISTFWNFFFHSYNEIKIMYYTLFPVRAGSTCWLKEIVHAVLKTEARNPHNSLVSYSLVLFVFNEEVSHCIMYSNGLCYFHSISCYYIIWKHAFLRWIYFRLGTQNMFNHTNRIRLCNFNSEVFLCDLILI